MVCNFFKGNVLCKSTKECMNAQKTNYFEINYFDWEML